jgi:hypothetical protein
LTLCDLITDVKNLGGGELIDNNGLFISAVNRSLRRLYSDISVEKTVRLAARVHKPIAYYKEIHCKSGEMREFPLEGMAYSMRIHGNCKYMITDGETKSVYPVNSKNEAVQIKGFVTYGGKISFWGSFPFAVYDLAVYDRIYSELTKDIPDCDPKKMFNLRELYGDFMSFTSPATDRNGRLIKGASLYDGRLEIDSDYEGEIIVTYRRLPIEISPDDDDPDIDAPNEYTHLLTLLVGYNYFFHSDEGLAKYYLTQYDEAIKNLKQNSYQRISSEYTNTNGWA